MSPEQDKNTKAHRGGWGGRLGRGFWREGTYLHLYLIHADVWQEPTQYCKAIILQLKEQTNTYTHCTIRHHKKIAEN